MKKNQLQGKNDYKGGSIWYGLFSGPKKKYCLTLNHFGKIDEHKVFKGSANVSDNLDWKDCFKMADSGKVMAKVPLSWKKSFGMGVVIPHEKGNCGECKNDSLCDNCDILVIQKKQFSANLNETKRQRPNELGLMLPN